MKKRLLRFVVMKWWIQFFIFFIFIFCIEKSKAQVIYDCVDTNRINPYYLCGDPTYDPVCGCNGVTYRNDCAAYYMGGVNYQTTGTCQDYGFDILQNPVAFYLTLSVYTKKKELVTVQIWNLFGKIAYQYVFNGYELNVQELTIDTYNWDRGMYVVLVIVNGQQQTKKFVKVTAL